MEDALPKKKTPSKPFIPQRSKIRSPFKRNGMGKIDWMRRLKEN
jgi:hypothetical protein